jgi:hypothetical protein
LRNENRELQRDVADRELAERIETTWQRSEGTYGGSGCGTSSTCTSTASVSLG